MHLCGKTFLPALRELHWEIMLSTSVELALLVSPSLQKLTLRINNRINHDQDHRTTDLNALLCNIVPRMSSLTYLRIDGLKTRDFFSILAPIHSLAGLIELDLRSNPAVANLDMLKLLAGMNGLECLTLPAIALSEDSFPEFCGFPKLRSIEILSIAADTALKVFNMFHPETVVYCILENKEEYWSSDQLLAVCESLAERCPKIEELSISSLVDNLDTLKDALAPLTKMRSAREVDLILLGDNTVHISESLIRSFATSWSHLVSLELSCNNARGTLSSRVLVAFADACPQLHGLYLPILDFPQTVVEEVSTFPIRTHGLEVLLVQNPRVKKADICALILDRLFSNIDVETIEGHCPQYGWSSSPEWDLVLQSLSFCQAARRNRTI